MSALVPLALLPGIFTNATPRTALNRWKDCDHVRFKDGLPQKLGGWTYRPLTGAQTVTYNTSPTTTALGTAGQILGKCRAIHDWTALDGTKIIALGTHWKLYLVSNYVLYDITPIASSGVLNNPFDTLNGSAVVTVHDAAHGMVTDDFANFSGAAAVGGITILGNYQVTVIDANTYTITHSSAAGATVVGGGGAAVAFAYEIDVGSDGDAGFGGWGIGTFGTPPGWNVPRALDADTAAALRSIRIWSLDTWGEDLMADARGTQIYTWDRSASVFPAGVLRATVIATSPTTSNWIAVAQEERILIAFGAHDGSVSDQMNVRWSDQEVFTDWSPTFTNRAGDNRLTRGSRIISAVSTRREIVIFTDTTLYAMQFVGGNDVFAFSVIGENVAIVGPNASAQVNGIVYFMSAQEFWVYDGVVRVLPCEVRQTVFGKTPTSINSTKLENTYAYINVQFNEVWWHYTSTQSTQNDRYVVFNFKDNQWYFGAMDRSAMHEFSSVLRTPYGVRAVDGKFFSHEDSLNDADTSGAVIALDSYLESYDTELGSGTDRPSGGDRFVHVSRMIPDFPRLIGGGTLTLKSRRYPQDPVQNVKGPYPVIDTTTNLSVRARNRQLAIRWDQTGLNADFRMGTWRMGTQPHGQR